MVRAVFAAIGQCAAIGTAPFGIDSIESLDDAPIRTSYALVRQLAPLILAHQGDGTITGFVLDAQNPSVTCELGGYELLIGLDRRPGAQVEHGCGIVIATDPDTFVGAGFGFQVTFRPATPGPALAGIEAVDEGEYQNGQWVAGRRLNGDETFGGSMWRFPASSSEVSSFPIPMLGPGTGIAHCRVYRYE